MIWKIEGSEKDPPEQSNRLEAILSIVTLTISASNKVTHYYRALRRLRLEEPLLSVEGLKA